MEYDKVYGRVLYGIYESMRLRWDTERMWRRELIESTMLEF